MQPHSSPWFRGIRQPYTALTSRLQIHPLSLISSQTSITSFCSLPLEYWKEREATLGQPREKRETTLGQPREKKCLSFLPIQYTWLLLGSPALLIAYLALCVSQLILAYPSLTYNPWPDKYSSLFTSAGSLKINFPQKWACYILTLQLTSCQVINVPVSNSVSCYMHFCI